MKKIKKDISILQGAGIFYQYININFEKNGERKAKCGQNFVYSSFATEINIE